MREYPLMGPVGAQFPHDYGRTLEQENARCHAGTGVFMKKVGRLAVALQQSCRPWHKTLNASAKRAASHVPGRGDVFGVVLRIPLMHQEAVIAAAAPRIYPADGGAGLIDGAATLLGIEELADLAEVRVG